MTTVVLANGEKQSGLLKVLKGNMYALVIDNSSAYFKKDSVKEIYQ